jgi:hypothetical protein
MQGLWTPATALVACVDLELMTRKSAAYVRTALSLVKKNRLEQPGCSLSLLCASPAKLETIHSHAYGVLVQGGFRLPVTEGTSCAAWQA